MNTTNVCPDDSGQWFPVAVVAARLCVSERTVQRRAKRGELEVREVSDEQGKRLLIRLDLPTGADNLPTPNHVQSVEAADSSPHPADKVLTAHLVEENRFLRGVIEQLQRDGAETRNALREALKLAPKQLAAPSPATPGATMGAPKAAPLTYGDIADLIEQELNR